MLVVLVVSWIFHGKKIILSSLLVFVAVAMLISSNDPRENLGRKWVYFAFNVLGRKADFLSLELQIFINDLFLHIQANKCDVCAI